MKTAIRCGRLFDGTSRVVKAGAVVVVEESRIIEVLPAGSAVEADRVIDAGDRTMLPGLIDTHVHIYGYHTQPGPPSPGARDAARDTLDIMRGLSALARAGVTTIRDCGYPHHGIFAVREAADSELIASPRLVLCGRALCASGGHGERISVTVDGEDAARRAARLESKAGADWIKLMATGGTATPGEKVSDVQLTLAEMRAAVEEAHHRGKNVCAHCSNLAGTKLALLAGIDSVEHGIELDDEAVSMMVERGVWLSPSLKCTQVEGEAEPGDNVPEFIRLKAAGIYRRQMESFQRAVKAGVRVSAATDGGPSYFPLTGRSLARELALMAELGLGAGGALEAATKTGAEVLGLPDIGTVEPGKQADLLVVDGDPYQDLMNLERPWLVMIRGRLVRAPSDEVATFPQAAAEMLR